MRISVCGYLVVMAAEVGNFYLPYMDNCFLRFSISLFFMRKIIGPLLANDQQGLRELDMCGTCLFGKELP